MAARIFGRLRSGIFATVFGMTWAGAALAGSAAPENAGISVDGVWCRLSVNRAHTAFVYMTLTVRGVPADTLVGAATPLAATAEMIAPAGRKRRNKFERIEQIPLDAHAPTVLQPEGPHFLLKGLHHDLQAGQSFIMTLSFAKAGKHDITVHVLSAAPGDGMPQLPSGVKLK
jgi:hypothetical protein